jgi:DNA-binding PucR family transcriptional regulator
VASSALGVTSSVSAGASDQNASPIYRITIPEGYRRWESIAHSQETEPLNELRAVLGNDVAIKAYREGTLPFPDGTVLAKPA